MNKECDMQTGGKILMVTHWLEQMNYVLLYSLLFCHLRREPLTLGTVVGGYSISENEAQRD